ncbi:hypothetical protein J2T11_002672 [Paenarthrobacter nicotinovorans]|nr:hypothetical protein [Paenarthrobacter nicotinovorans]
MSDDAAFETLTLLLRIPSNLMSATSALALLDTA